MDQQWLLDDTHVSFLYLLTHVSIHFGVQQLLEVFISNGVSFDIVDCFVQELTSSLLQAVVIVDWNDGFLALGHDNLHTEELLVEKLISNSNCTRLDEQDFVDFIVLILYEW